jgi:hypothetical protein
MPSEASHFVPNVLRPVKQFFTIGHGDGGPGAHLRDRYLKEYATEIFNAVTTRLAASGVPSVVYLSFNL